MKISSSEKHIQQLFESRFNIVLKKIDDHDGKEGRTSDFEYLKEGQRIFVCELKELIDVPLSEEYGFRVVTHPNGVKEAYRQNNATNRISNAIKDAYEQLPKYREPKVLLILNFSRFLRVDDLDETYRGYRVLSSENGITYLDTFAKRASEGRIKEIKKNIDLYIWIDASNEDTIFFITVSNDGEKIKNDFFSKSSAVT